MMMELFFPKNVPIFTINFFFPELDKCHRPIDLEQKDDEHVINLNICVFFEYENIPVRYEKQLKKQLENEDNSLFVNHKSTQAALKHTSNHGTMNCFISIKICNLFQARSGNIDPKSRIDRMLTFIVFLMQMMTLSRRAKFTARTRKFHSHWKRVLYFFLKTQKCYLTDYFSATGMVR